MALLSTMTSHQKSFNLMLKMAEMRAIRPEIVAFSEGIANKLKEQRESRQFGKIIIHAPVKSGKRGIVECIRMLYSERSLHVFVSMFHRKADDHQRRELEAFLGANTVFSGYKDMPRVKARIERAYNEGMHVVVHIDECDFASGFKQGLSVAWKSLNEIYSPSGNGTLTAILYSATPIEAIVGLRARLEEIETSESDFEEDDGFRSACSGVEPFDGLNFFKEDACVFKFKPPSNYVGIQFFIENSLAKEATPFFKYVKGTVDKLELTEQGKECVEQLLASTTKTRVGIVRLDRKIEGAPEKNGFQTLLRLWHTIPEFANVQIIFDEADASKYKDKTKKHFESSRKAEVSRIEWSDRKFWNGLVIKNEENFEGEIISSLLLPTLIFNRKTANRSTELKGHDRIVFTHNYSNGNYNTICQADERVVHYTVPLRSEEGYNSPCRIQVYGSLSCMKLSAGLIDVETFYSEVNPKLKKDGRHLSDRVSVKKTKHSISSSSGDGITSSDQDIVKVCFIPCTKDTYKKDVPQRMKEFWKECGRNEEDFKLPTNPFIESEKHILPDGKYPGYIRSWKLINFTEDFTDKAWGLKSGSTHQRITVAYKGDESGVFYRVLCIDDPDYEEDVEVETKISMKAFSSMYEP